MKDVTKQEVLKQLGLIAEQFPEMRLCQLICNLASLVTHTDDSALWDLEDEQLLEAITTFKSSMHSRLSEVA